METPNKRSNLAEPAQQRAVVAGRISEGEQIPGAGTQEACRHPVAAYLVARAPTVPTQLADGEPVGVPKIYPGGGVWGGGVLASGGSLKIYPGGG